MVYVVLFMHTHFYLLSIHYNFMDLSKALLFLALCMKRERERARGGPGSTNPIIDKCCSQDRNGRHGGSVVFPDFVVGLLPCLMRRH